MMILGRQLRTTGRDEDPWIRVGTARLLIVISDKEQATITQTQSSEVQHLNLQITAITEQVASLVTPQQLLRSKVIHCFERGQLGHLQCESPNHR